MCFETTKYSKPKRAEKDISCWKMLNVDYTPLYHRTNPPYESGVLNPIIKLKKVLGDWLYSIYEGYHSYRVKEEAIYCADELFAVGNTKTLVKEFIIPKGTLYYKNKEEYVSETIIMK